MLDGCITPGENLIVVLNLVMTLSVSNQISLQFVLHPHSNHLNHGLLMDH